VPATWSTSQCAGEHGRGRRPERRRTQRSSPSIPARSISLLATSACDLGFAVDHRRERALAAERAQRAARGAIETGKRVLARDGHASPDGAHGAVLRRDLVGRAGEAPVLRNRAAADRGREHRRAGRDPDGYERDPLDTICQPGGGEPERVDETA
jgi:hypothetical protein